MSEDKKNEQAGASAPAKETKKSPDVLAACRVIKHRAKIGGVIAAKGARINLPAETAKALEGAGFVEVLGVGAAADK